MLLRVLYLLGGGVSLFLIPSDYLLYPILGYIFMSICNGTIAHRYFVHEQFTVNSTGRWVLGFLATIGMYSPINYWIIQHKHHHRNSDKTSDIHSPNQGFFHSLILWPFKIKYINSVFQERSSLALLNKTGKDKIVSFYSRYFIQINIVFLCLLLIANLEIALYFYLAGYLLDFIRIGLINSICHMQGFPGNYRNHLLDDRSYNNILLGYLTLGFAWHNNHHANASRLNLREKWWEVDVEGIAGSVLSKVFYVRSKKTIQ